MRPHLRRFIKICRETLPLSEPVYEFGSLQVQGDCELENLRTLFPAVDYVGSDIRPGDGVDVVLDLHQLNLPDETVGTALCMDTLEHVEYPRQAVREMHRGLRKDGILIMSSVMHFPIHGYPNDYWRFTPAGFRSLLNIFDECFVGHTGSDAFPHSIVGIGFKGTPVSLEAFAPAFQAWQHRCNANIKKLES